MKTKQPLTRGRLKKLLFAVLLTAAMVFTLGTFTACGPKADYTIGVSQLVKHSALDKANTGFTKELTRLMNLAEKTVAFKQRNAAGEQSTCTSIANSFNAQGVDAIFAIATPAAISSASATTESKIPVVFTAVTDAISCNLVQSNEAPGGNVTGVLDINPVADQIELAYKLASTSSKGVATKIGFLYANSEANSKYQLNIAKAAVEQWKAENIPGLKDIEIIDRGISDINNIATDYNALIEANVGSVYIPTDNVIASAINTIKQENMRSTAKRPIVCGEEDPTSVCGIATYGVDYTELGKKAARMVYKILVNGINPANMPVEDMLADAVFKLYEDNADEIGYTITDEIRGLAQ